MATVREAKLEDIKDIAKVHVDSWRTTYQGIVEAILKKSELQGI